ncbi:nuclear transport factor 2 family protein [Novosphingobium umbonatum]|uniref:Nuclear transport factor 2 family protein n=1 Tax=Novosphingobium umbonatum TaxID=1908524 RepID=A0A437N6Z8_9SPHN|nr:nuclear transport factor 2 family protein [Novosphingobium umbonatum]RVU05705.1 nuclear transport factor 2 family protein [Novosphingobium umbonatum]
MNYAGPLADRIAIRELIETYAHGVMTRDAAIWAATWAEDAYWALPEFPDLGGFSGKAAIVAGWTESMKVYGLDNCSKPMIYVATPGRIVVQGDSAEAVVYTSEIFDDPASGKRLRVRGRYDDLLTRQGEGWLFKQRTYRTMLVDG